MRIVTAGVALLWGAMLTGAPALAQAGCAAGGYRVLAERWDPVLGSGWELRQDCAHPAWPNRLVFSSALRGTSTVRPASAQTSLFMPPPALVRAGDPVRLWMQNEAVRIEMRGVAEQPGRSGERVTVRIERQGGEDGLRVQHLAGIVRGAGDVEMER